MCFELDTGSTELIEGDSLAVFADGQKYFAQWVGLYGSFSGKLVISLYDTWLPDPNYICYSGCRVGLSIGKTQEAQGGLSFNGTMPQNNGCREPGVDCKPSYAWYANSTYISYVGQVGNFSEFSVSGSIYEPTWILVVDGPTQMYTLPGGITVQGYSTGVPVPYVWGVRFHKCYGDTTLGCSDGHASWGGASGGEEINIIFPPVEEEDTVCEFWFDDDTLNLGTVDQKSAVNASASAHLSGICNADTSVNLRASPSEIKMGGLTIRMMFDDYDSNTKLNWDLSENRTGSTPLWAVVTDVGTLIPNSYSRSGVVYIDYN